MGEHHRDVTEARARMEKLLAGYRMTQALYVVSVLAIPDLLADGPRTVEQLAHAADADPDALRRLLQTLSSEGVFREEEHDRFTNTELSAVLRSSSNGSVRPAAVFVGEEHHWASWGSLLHSVRTGETAMHTLYGTDVWAYRAAHPHSAELFDALMAALTGPVSAAVAAAYDFSSVKTVVDVAGGNGTLLRAVLTAYPDLQGVLFDQLHVIEAAKPAIEASPEGARCRLEAGSMFEGVPVGGDVYLLKSILHDWSDEQSVEILRQIAAVLGPDNVLLVVERLLGGRNRGPETRWSDLNMLVVLGGRERTAAEFAELADRAGLRVRDVRATGTPFAVVEMARALG